MRRGASRNQIDPTASARQRRRDATPTLKQARAATGMGTSNYALTLAHQGGAPLDPRVRADMEARFGESFTDVQVHDDAAAHASARAFGAKAYTQGEDIVFGAGRFAPEGADGRRLLAHELAHVVQQRRGGAAPPMSADAPHEQAATQAAAQIAGGAPSVAVGGATGVGIAREEDDKAKKDAPADAAWLAQGARALQPGPTYWLDHPLDVSSMQSAQLYDEANELDEYLYRQRQSTPDVVKLEAVRDQMRNAIAAREKREGAGAKKPGSKQAKAAKKPAPAQPAGSASAPVPRFLREQSSVKTDDPVVLQREYNEISAYLQGDQASPVERRMLQAELTNLKPALGTHLMRRSMERNNEAIGRAITVESNDPGTQLLESMKRIDSIQPMSEMPGFSYLLHGHEMIVMSDEQAEALREGAKTELAQMARAISSANQEIKDDYHEFVDRTYEKHKYVGFISMMRSGENPLDWREKLYSILAGSNIAKREYDKLRDPWAGRATLQALAENVAAGERISDAARTYLEYKIGLVLEGTAGAVAILQRTKQVGQIASNFAFSPAGAALYSASESFLEQASEIHYGQRESFDFAGIAFDATANYIGNKVTGGIGSLAGKSAPLWLRGATYFIGDRAGASVSTGVRMSLDRASGRSDATAADIFTASMEEGVNWKQGLFNLALMAGGHFVQKNRNWGAALPKSEAPTWKQRKADKAFKRASAEATSAEGKAGRSEKKAGDLADDLQKALTRAKETADKQAEAEAKIKKNAGLIDEKQKAIDKTRPTAVKTRERLQGEKSTFEGRLESAKRALEQATGVADRAKARAQAKQQAADAARAEADAARGKATAARAKADALGPTPDPAAVFDPKEKAFSPAPDAELPKNDPNDPLVWTYTGPGKKRGTYVANEPKGRGKENYTAKPKSWAEAEGFRPAGDKSGPTPIEPRMKDGRQVESGGAGGAKGAKFVSATAKEQSAVETTSIRPDLSEAGSYNHHLDQGEFGILRPQGSNAPGVDSITAKVEFDRQGKPVRAEIYLNDATTPTAEKGAKASHAQWEAALDRALDPKAPEGQRLDFKDPAIEAAIRKAAKNGDVYVRVVRTEPSPTGTPSVTVNPAETRKVGPMKLPLLWGRVPQIGKDEDEEKDR